MGVAGPPPKKARNQDFLTAANYYAALKQQVVDAYTLSNVIYVPSEALPGKSDLKDARGSNLAWLDRRIDELRVKL
jgi:hypothetical protein